MARYQNNTNDRSQGALGKLAGGAERGGGVRILNLGSEMRYPIPAMGVKFADPESVSIMKAQNIFLICSL